MLLAHVVAGGKSTVASFMSNQSAGNGLYMGSDPVTFLGHFEGSGVVCRLGGKTKRIVSTYRPDDIHHWSGALVKHDSSSVLYSPTGYNSYVWPAALEAGARGFILNWKPSTYTSKCAIDLTRACRKIDIDDFRKCDWFEKMVPVAMQQDALGKYLNDASASFGEKFWTIWDKCIEEKPSLCAKAMKKKLTELPEGHTLKEIQVPSAKEFESVKTNCKW
jgi:hypothetical protein